MKIWINNLKRILWEDSFDAVELFGSVNALGWGIWFIVHPDLFQLSKVYATLASFADIYTWGGLFLCLGLMKMFGILSDRYFIRKWVSLVATFGWTFMFLTFWQASPNALLVFITAEITLYSVWEFFRHARRQNIRRVIREKIKKGKLI